MSSLLMIHSLLRWVALILLLVATAQAWRGWLGKQAWTDGHKRLGLFTMISFDVQLLVGLMVFAASDLVKLAMSNMGEAMRNPALRFFTVEHTSMMVAAIALVHIGFAKAKRGTDDAQRFKTLAIFFTLALVAVVAAIPWPFRAAIQRGLLPF
jgi:hypothetical protein